MFDLSSAFGFQVLSLVDGIFTQFAMFIEGLGLPVF